MMRSAGLEPLFSLWGTGVSLGIEIRTAIIFWSVICDWISVLVSTFNQFFHPIMSRVRYLGIGIRSLKSQRTTIQITPNWSNEICVIRLRCITKYSGRNRSNYEESIICPGKKAKSHASRNSFPHEPPHQIFSPPTMNDVVGGKIEPE